MSLTGNLETNSIGGFGFGGIAPVGIVGLNNLFDRDRRDHGHGHDGCADKLLLMNAIGNLKDSVAEAKDSLADRVEGTKDALTSRMESAKDTLVREARDLDNEICDVKGKILETKYDLAIQAERNTNEIKNQAQAFQIANDRKLDELSRQISADGDATRALINQNTINDLRDQLFAERRIRDGREIEISINNSNTQTQAQVQAQFQTQNDFLSRRFHEFDTQINRTQQGIVNLGTMTASGTQATQATNIH